eukprot:scaffold123505_cov59-Phaeocystis_antarctica.AAC.1
MTHDNHTRRALENRRPGTRKLDLVCVQSSVTKQLLRIRDTHMDTHHVRAKSQCAASVLCPDGAAGVVARGMRSCSRGRSASDTTR